MRADSIAGLYPYHSLKNLRLLSGKLTSQLSTDEEKFRAIYKWVCLNIEYDNDLYERIDHKRATSGKREFLNWNKAINSHAMWLLLERYQTVCTGYAWLIRELSHHAGLPCEIIDGYGRNASSNVGGKGIANHSWNAVQLNHKWYLCDPTWSSGYMITSTKVFVRSFSECYFLADPSVFVRSHYPLDVAWSLVPDPPTLPEFLNAPIVYASALCSQAIPLFPATLKVKAIKGETISFRLSKKGEEVTDQLKLVINRTSIGVSKSKNIYYANHTFERKGTYAVHFKIDGQYVASYSVTVQ